jgi:hypothetical protein
VYRSANGTTYTPLAGTPAASPFTDSTASANTAYLYKVHSVAGGESADSNIDLATTVIFTDPTLSVGVTPVKAVHVAELRVAVNAVRNLAGIGDQTFADPVSGTLKATHVSELRTGLNAGRTAANVALPPATFSDPALVAGTQVKAAHIIDLRNGVK